MSRGEPTMPRTPEEFNNYVAKELRAGGKRMDLPHEYRAGVPIVEPRK